jgi:hypothetical protein
MPRPPVFRRAGNERAVLPCTTGLSTADAADHRCSGVGTGEVTGNSSDGGTASSSGGTASSGVASGEVTADDSCGVGAGEIAASGFAGAAGGGGERCH